MTRYLQLKGIITSISESRTGGSGAASCTLLFSIQGEDGNVFSFVISPSTYVLNQESFRPGDTIIAFYDSLAPMPLIYPPSYQAVAAIKPWKEQSAMLDVFDQNLKNSDNSLVLNLSPATNIRTQNGQIFTGRLANQLLLVLYTATTRSLPPQTTPDEVVVFCPVS